MCFYQKLAKHTLFCMFTLHRGEAKIKEHLANFYVCKNKEIDKKSRMRQNSKELITMDKGLGDKRHRETFVKNCI